MPKDVQAAAALILAMSTENSAKVLKFFSQEEIIALARVSLHLGQVGHDEMDFIIESFNSEFRKPTPIEGSKETTIHLISNALPKEIAQEVTSEIFGIKKTVWQEMQTLSPEHVANILASEHPQTIAYIVKQCDEEYAASFLKRLEPDLKLQTILGMMHANDPSPAVIDILNNTFRDEISWIKSSNPDNSSLDSVAAILNNMDLEESNNVIENIKTHNPGIMKELEIRIFAFDDLWLLPSEKLKQVLDIVRSHPAWAAG